MEFVGWARSGCVRFLIRGDQVGKVGYVSGSGWRCGDIKWRSLGGMCLVTTRGVWLSRTDVGISTRYPRRDVARKKTNDGHQFH